MTRCPTLLALLPIPAITGTLQAIQPTTPVLTDPQGWRVPVFTSTDAPTPVATTRGPTPATDETGWIPLGPSGGDARAITTGSDGRRLLGLSNQGGPEGGLYRSLDDGATWHAYGEPGWPTPGNTTLRSIGVFAVASTNTGDFAGTADGLWTGNAADDLPWIRRDLGVGAEQQVLAIASATDGTLWVGLADGFGAQRNVLLRSDNGGLSWTPAVPPGLALGLGCQAIAVDPADPNRLVACFGGVLRDGAVYTSTDAGATWFNQMPPGIDAPMYDAHLDNARVLVCGGLAFGNQPAGLFEGTLPADNTPITWTDQTATWPADQRRLLTALAVDPTDPSRIYTGGPLTLARLDGATWTFNLGAARAVNDLQTLADGTLIAATDGTGVLQSTTLGDTFTPANVGLDARAISDMALHTDDLGTTTIAVSSATLNDGGVLTSTDAGTTWTSADTPAQRFTSIAFDPSGRLHATGQGPISPTAQEGIYRDPGDGTAWTALGPNAGTGFEIMVDHVSFGEEPPYLLAGGADASGPVSTRAIWRADADGANWERVHTGPERERVAAFGQLTSPAPITVEESLTLGSEDGDDDDEEDPTSFPHFVPTNDTDVLVGVVLRADLTVATSVVLENQNEEAGDVEATANLGLTIELAGITVPFEGLMEEASDAVNAIGATDEVDGSGTDTRTAELSVTVSTDQTVDTMDFSPFLLEDGVPFVISTSIEPETSGLENVTILEGEREVTITGTLTIEYQYAPSRSAIVVASFLDVGTLPLEGGVLKSIDAGRTWTESGGGLPNTAQPAAVAITGTAVLLADSAVGGNNGGLHTSEDDGATWTRTRHIGPIERIVVDPRSDNVLYATTPDASGVLRSIDGGDTFEPFPGAELATLGITTVNAIAVEPTDPPRLLIATGAGVFARAIDYIPFPTFFVDHAVSESGLGDTWTNAFDTLEEALTAARFTGTSPEIRIASGTYTPDLQAGFQLPDGVVLRGGYQAGTTDARAGDPFAFPTILSGDRAGDDASGATDDNALHVLVAPDAGIDNGLVAEGVIIEACVIADGRATGTGDDARGGALLVRNGRARLDRCLITNCIATEGGAVITGINSEITVQGCLITGVDSGTGGAIQLLPPAEGDTLATLAVGNATIYRNSGAGAIENATDTTPTVSNTIIWQSGPADTPALIGTLEVRYSCVEFFTPVEEDGNTAFDPLLTDPVLQRDSLGRTILAFRPVESSVCVDTGERTLLLADRADLDADRDRTELIPIDLAGGNRVEGGVPEIGAIELIPDCERVAELNQDGDTNILDLLIFIEQYLADRDGIGVSRLLAFLECWLEVGYGGAG